MFEVMPPQRRASHAVTTATIARIKEVVESLDPVKLINIPEVTEENYEGVPLYKHQDVSEFGSLLYNSIKIDVVANKVTTYLKSEQEFKVWLDKAVDTYRIKHFVFVGGNTHMRKYPGHSVVRANRIASQIDGIKIGNICIPSRPDEVDRLITKTESGASFFTTQLVFESASMKYLLTEYSAKCKEKGINPAAFYVSMAPAHSQFDIDFFKWLGANLPGHIEAEMRDSSDITGFSTALAAKTYSEISGFVKDKKIKVDVSPNIEVISNANLDSAHMVIDSIVKSAK